MLTTLEQDTQAWDVSREAPEHRLDMEDREGCGKPVPHWNVWF